MSVQEGSVKSSGVAVMDGRAEIISTQKAPSDSTNVKTHPTLILNGEATTAELCATSELEEATEGLSLEEPKAVPLLRANGAPLAPADQLWSSSRHKAVRLRMEGSGPASETPITVHQLFLETVEAYGDHPALVSKKEGQWVTLTWRQYYEQCRAAAKSFLK
ncbi:long-chain-fatty-acid--CoA ligase ACSBG2-like, partial [Anarrhichthys ocellatus]|uniref:long-chain-fatty-acid--CoA ligase ACSBG2-like n=1 Tax=Anarrhichthys ocellatus TaxID=433405 RepID=UPI0012ED9ECE